MMTVEKYIFIFFIALGYHTTKIVVNYELPVINVNAVVTVGQLLNVCRDIHTGAELRIPP